jgi:hypothetical protein
MSCAAMGCLLLFYNYYVVDNYTKWPNVNEYTFKGEYKTDQWRYWLYPGYTVVVTLLTLVPTTLVLKRLFTKGTNP